MSLDRNLVVACRWLFGALFLTSTVLAWQILPVLNIDTDLADVSPKIRNTVETQKAIASLRSSIEQRATLLIQGLDEYDVYDAEDYLREELDKLQELTVFESNQVLVERLFDGLLDYRFSLLSAPQRKALQASSARDIATVAESNLYKSASMGQIITFDKDPLGWHSETLLDLLQSSQSGVGSRSVEQGFAQSVSFKINQGALSLDTQERISVQLSNVIELTENSYNVKLDTSGVFFFAASAASSAKADIQLISIGSGIGVILLLLVAFRSLWSLILPLSSIAIGVTFAFLLTHLIYGQVHILTLVFGASLIGIVIDYSLHYFYHAPGQVAAGQQQPILKHDGGSHAALHRALLLSLGTSLIGYGALSFSSLAALQKVAFFSCCGLLMAWLSVMCFGGWASSKATRSHQRFFPALVKLLSGSVSYLSSQFWLALVLLVVVSVSVIAIIDDPFSDDPRIFFKPSSELIESERRVSAATNDFEPGRYLIIHGDSQSQVYERYNALITAVTNSSDVDSNTFSSLLSWVPSPDQQMENYEAYAKLYNIGGSADILAQALGIDRSSIEAVRAEYLNSKNRVLSPADVNALLGDAMPNLWIEHGVGSSEPSFISFVLLRKGEAADALSNLTANIEGVEFINTLERTRGALEEQRQSALGLLFFAYVLVALLVFIRYRSVNALWMVAIPICASASFVGTCMMLGVPLNLFHVMALFLVLGFGMDYTIFAKEMRGQSKMQLGLALQAILLSALTSLLSFGLLGLSSMPVVASFGITLLLGNMFNLLGVFVAISVLNKRDVRLKISATNNSTTTN